MHQAHADQLGLEGHLPESMEAKRQAAARVGQADQRLSALDLEVSRIRSEADGNVAAPGRRCRGTRRS